MNPIVLSPIVVDPSPRLPTLAPLKDQSFADNLYVQPMYNTARRKASCVVHVESLSAVLGLGLDLAVVIATETLTNHYQRYRDPISYLEYFKSMEGLYQLADEFTESMMPLPLKGYDPCRCDELQVMCNVCAASQPFIEQVTESVFIILSGMEFNMLAMPVFEEGDIVRCSILDPSTIGFEVWA